MPSDVQGRMAAGNGEMRVHHYVCILSDEVEQLDRRYSSISFDVSRFPVCEDE